MKRFMTLCLLAFGLTASQIAAKAQSTGPQGSSVPPKPAGAFPELGSPISNVDATSRSPSASPIHREPKVVKKGILAPAANDVAQYQFLLSQKNTGMMRLLPREDYDSGVYKVRKRLDMRGGGAYFSFHHRAHEYGYGSDISYEHGLLSVGFAGANYGMMTDLGDTPLEPITAEDPRAHFLLNYKPPKKEYDARIEARKFYPAFGCDGVTGFTFDGVEYFRAIPAILNHTYLIRSIDYEISDLLVAFRVVRSEDGILTIAWKILKQFSAPKLIRDDIKVPGTVTIIGPCRRP